MFNKKISSMTSRKRAVLGSVFLAGFLFLNGFAIFPELQAITEEEGAFSTAVRSNQLGIEEYKRGAFEEALAYFTEAADMDDRLWQPHFNCAVSLVKMGFPEEALVHLEASLQVDPENPIIIQFYDRLAERVWGFV